MAIKVKVGVELDSKSVKASLDSTLKSLESKKIKLNIDMTSLKQLQSTISELSKSMNNLKMPNINTGGTSNAIKQTTDAIKQQNTDLKAQQTTYQSLRSLQNEEYSIRTKLVSATGDYKSKLEGQLGTIVEQRTALLGQVASYQEAGSSISKLVQLDDQRLKKQRELESATVKYQQSMNKLKDDAISNLNTKGMSTKEIDEYKNKIESIDTVSLDQVKSEIAAVNKEMANGKQSAQDMAENLKRTGESMSSAGTAIMKAFAIPAAGLGLGVKTFADFEYQMDQVAAVSDLTGAELSQLTDLAKQLGRDTMFSAQQAAEGMATYARAGWNANQIMAAMPATLDLVSASGEDFNTISNIMADGLSAFGMSASDAIHFADVLAQAANKSNVDVGQLGESFKFAAPLASSLGYSIEDVATALAVMANNSIKGEQGGTNLRALLVNLALKEVA